MRTLTHQGPGAARKREAHLQQSLEAMQPLGFTLP